MSKERQGKAGLQNGADIQDYLKDKLDAAKSYEQRDAVAKLQVTAAACKEVFNFEHSNIPPDIVEHHIGARPSVNNPSDNHQRHGERTAQVLVEMGDDNLVDFSIAYLHDMGNSDIWSYAKSRIKTKIGGAFKRLGMPNSDEMVEEIIQGIEEFDQLDTRSQAVSAMIFEETRERFPFGHEFTPTQFNDLKKYVIQAHTNVIRDIGRTKRKKSNTATDIQEAKDDPNKFPSIIKVFRDATTESDSSDNQGRHVQSKVKHSLHLAYLAASIENVRNPKVGKTLEDSQRIALSLQQGHLPIYWSMDSKYANAAEEVIFRAYFPEAYNNLETAWTELQAEQNNRYFEYHRDVFARFMDDQILSRIKEAHGNVRELSEADMAASEANFRRKHWRDLGLTTDSLLKPNEVFIHPIDIKSPSSLFRKALKHVRETIEAKVVKHKKETRDNRIQELREKMNIGLLSDAEKTELDNLATQHDAEEAKKVKQEDERVLKDEIMNLGFGTKEFWLAYAQSSYDIFRTRIIMGDEVMEKASGVLLDLDHFELCDPDSVQRVAAEDMKNVWGKNCARTPFQVTDEDSLFNELVEELYSKPKVNVPEKLKWIKHIVLGLPIEGIIQNLEIHIAGWRAYFESYVGKSNLYHLNYKTADQIVEMAKTANLTEEQIKILKEEAARLSILLKDQFLASRNLTPKPDQIEGYD